MVKKPTHASDASNLTCGDETAVSLKVENDKIAEIKHQTMGCAICLAGISILSDDLIGKSVDEVEQMNSDDLVKLVGIEITPSRLKCLNLGLEAVKKALENVESI